MEVVRSGLDGPLDTIAEVVAAWPDTARARCPRPRPPRHGPGLRRHLPGLVVQQAWEPDLDVSAYMESVLGILEGLAAAARAEATIA